MAYRRRQGITRSTTFKEDCVCKTNEGNNDNFNSFYQQPSSTASSNSLAAQAIKASSAHRHISSEPQRSKVFEAYEDTGRDAAGFWGVLARKTKAIIEEDTASPQFKTTQQPSSQFQTSDSLPAAESRYSNPMNEAFRKVDNPAIRKGLDRITSSLNQIGDTFEKAFEEGRTMVGNKTADLKLQIKRKGSGLQDQSQSPRDQMAHETQLKASRDVAMATAAKAKLLLRELKSVKADLAFAKLRCTQLEEENKILRESRDKGANPADDDMIRLQLETLLAEKGRLAHENSIYTRENRFLREIVEYHQLTMQDVVYLDEGNEEVTEVSSLTKMLPISPASPASLFGTTCSLSSQQMKESQREPDVQEEMHQVPESEGQSPRDQEASETEAEVPAPVPTNKGETAINTPNCEEENAQMTSQASK